MRADYKTTMLQGITDLTLMAPIKTGFVAGAFEAETYVERLERVLRVLNALRRAARESALHPNPFADSIGRFRGIHFFRFAIVPPEPSKQAPQLGTYRLLLNVTFDGGWEPYMRIIWGPLGTLLDLIFCHCDCYPATIRTDENGEVTQRASYQTYIDWVRSREVPSSFFYADSAATVADVEYLRQCEAQQRTQGGSAMAHLQATGLALAAQAPDALATPYAVQAALRGLKALAGLRPLFPLKPDGDAGFLLRLTQNLLQPLRVWIASGLFDAGHPFDVLRPTFDDERVWLMAPRPAPATSVERLRFNPAAVQAGIAEPLSLGDSVVHGALVMLRIVDVSAAVTWLSNFGVTPGGASAHPVVLSLALTYSGLQRLKLPKTVLDKLPQEFVEGMEARAGILGDLRANHPDAWSRPQRYRPTASQVSSAGSSTPRPLPPVDLVGVHVLVQLRTARLATDPKVAGQELLPRLEPLIGGLEEGSGLSVLAVQAMRQNAVRAPDSGRRGHFDFVDGFSQPTLQAGLPAPLFWSDTVKPGELFLGYGNERKDGPGDADEWLDNGSFLVLRKLRQRTDRLNQVVAQAAGKLTSGNAHEQMEMRELIRAKLMGRQSDGTSLIDTRGNGDNDFDYRGDSQGAACPFASHSRRANPRDARPLAPPRIARRGMSYGEPGADGSGNCGLMFMAYGASIAEQFEVIQRWLAGGNSSGVGSAQDDPFLGVPETGKARVFCFQHDGQVLRVDLGNTPLVELQWGLYAFVPSLAALKRLPEILKPEIARPLNPERKPGPEPKREPDGTPMAKQTGTDATDPGSKEEWKRLLEDGTQREAAWASVRNANGGAGVLRTLYGLLVASPAAVLEVLQDDGTRFSVCGYGKRLSKSIGLGYLGQDDAGPHKGHLDHAPGVNAAIESAISEADAYDAALNIGQRVLAAGLAAAEALSGQRKAPLDLTDYVNAVIHSLCTLWFGVPDGKFVKAGKRSDLADAPAICPGALLAVARYVFSPDPAEIVRTVAEKQGDNLKNAMAAYLAAAGVNLSAKLTAAIVAALPGEDTDLRSRTVTGVLLGFPPTVIGNLLTVLASWNKRGLLGPRQDDLLALGHRPSHADASSLLRGPLLATMSRAPVPHMDWRMAVASGNLRGVAYEANDPVIVGLGSAMQVSGATSKLMFGGDRNRNSPEKTVHACPGYAMAMGVMMGTIAAVLLAGSLQSTASPLVLTLTAAG